MWYLLGINATTCASDHISHWTTRSLLLGGDTGIKKWDELLLCKATSNACHQICAWLWAKKKKTCGLGSSGIQKIKHQRDTTTQSRRYYQHETKVWSSTWGNSRLSALAFRVIKYAIGAWNAGVDKKGKQVKPMKSEMFHSHGAVRYMTAHTRIKHQRGAFRDIIIEGSSCADGKTEFFFTVPWFMNPVNSLVSVNR